MFRLTGELDLSLSGSWTWWYAHQISLITHGSCQCCTVWQHIFFFARQPQSCKICNCLTLHQNVIEMTPPKVVWFSKPVSSVKDFVSSKLLMHANSNCVVKTKHWKDASGKKTRFRKFGAVAMGHGNSRDGNTTRTKADFLFCISEFTYLLTQNEKREPAEKCSVT